MKKIKVIKHIFTLAVIVSGMWVQMSEAHAKFLVSAPETVKIGKQICITTNDPDPSFQSTDPMIVSDE